VSAVINIPKLSQVKMKSLQILTVLVSLLTLCHAIQIEYFVKPNDSIPCPGFPCYTLSHYLEHTTRYFTSNTRINFLPGVHKIDKGTKLYIRNVWNLTLAGYDTSSSHAADRANIVSMKPATLIFVRVMNLVIKHISIIYCGYPLSNDLKKSSAAMHMFDITSLKLLSISVENSTGYGIMGRNVLGNSSVSHSRFIFNNYYTLTSTNCSYGLVSCTGGNMLLYYGKNQPETLVTTTVTTSVLSIDSCVFSDGVDISDQLSGGLTILLNLYNIHVSIRNVVSTRNVAKRGANFLFGIRDNIGSIKIINMYEMKHSMGQDLH